MSASYSYPGIYIQELVSSSNAIVPTPTSIAAFVGYSHPYQTTAGFNTAEQIFSFNDYQRLFGGLFSSGLTDASLLRGLKFRRRESRIMWRWLERQREGRLTFRRDAKLFADRIVEG